jgi:hypothetical protein
MRALVLCIITLAIAVLASAQDQSDSLKSHLTGAAQRSSLTTPGSRPFHIKMKVLDTRKEHPEYNTLIEIWWAAPEQWRREIKSSSFSQTATQNGPQYSESNSSDYLPWWLHNLLTESLVPVPLAELQRLDMRLQGPPDHRCVDWERTFTAGPDRITIPNFICFNSDDTLSDLFTRTADARFDDYRSFGHKKVARSIRSWTYSQDYKTVELRTVVTVLEPLHETAAQFAIASDAGLNTRLRFVTVSESALRDLKLYAPQPKWPLVDRQPLSGLMTVNLKIDRQGLVREVGAPISRNVELSDSAREQLKTWKFKPFLVDGAPVQVSVDVVLKFQTKIKP